MAKRTKRTGRWVTWHRQRAGNDGRKPSGIVMTRTSRAHATVDGKATLCGDDIGTGTSTKYPTQKCTACLRLVSTLHVAVAYPD